MQGRAHSHPTACNPLLRPPAVSATLGFSRAELSPKSEAAPGSVSLPARRVLCPAAVAFDPAGASRHRGLPSPAVAEHLHPLPGEHTLTPGSPPTPFQSPARSVSDLHLKRTSSLQPAAAGTRSCWDRALETRTAQDRRLPDAARGTRARARHTPGDFTSCARRLPYRLHAAGLCWLIALAGLNILPSRVESGADRHCVVFTDPLASCYLHLPSHGSLHLATPRQSPWWPAHHARRLRYEHLVKEAGSGRTRMLLPLTEEDADGLAAKLLRQRSSLPNK